MYWYVDCGILYVAPVAVVAVKGVIRANVLAVAGLLR